MNSRPHRQTGFTLLELLIAIALFALLGVGTWRLMDTVLRADSQSQRQEQDLRQLSRALWIFERDLQQLVARPIRDIQDRQQPALSLSRDQERPVLELTRSGWNNPTGLPRAELQRVRWQWQDGQLQRLFWNVLDPAPDSRPRVQEALPHLNGLEIRVLDSKNQWQRQWPLPDPDTGTEAQPVTANPDAETETEPDTATTQVNVEHWPRALEVILQTPTFGEISRRIPLVDGLAATAPQAPEAQDDAAAKADDKGEPGTTPEPATTGAIP